MMMNNSLRFRVVYHNLSACRHLETVEPVSSFLPTWSKILFVFFDNIKY